MENWENINAVHRMQEYIEQYITEPITLYMLASVAGYSPWHAARVFKEYTGKTPFEYIRALRLSRAAIQLRDNENVRIIDIALDFAFDSHEGFTRSFSKQFGISPQRYSKKYPPLNLFMPSSIRDYYLMKNKGVIKMSEKANTIFVQVIDRPARKLILKRGIKAKDYFEYCEEVGCDVWGVLSSIKQALYEPIGMWLPDNLRKVNTSIYAQGVEVPMDYNEDLIEGFELIELKPCKMMVFQGQPFEDEHFCEAIDEVWNVIKDYNPEIYGFKWADEDGPRFQLSPMGYRGYIEARAVRQV